MWREFRYAARSLRRSRTFLLAATAALGLAIGANATIFSVVDGLWLRPAGFANVGRSVRIFSTSDTSQFGRWSYPEYLTLRDGTASFSSVVACGRRGTVVPLASGDPELVLVNVVSLDFFEALGIVPTEGRLFGTTDEAALDAQASVVLGHAYWRRRFGGDQGVIGQAIRLGGSRPVIATILGVLPASFRELDAATDRDLWVPPATWRQLGNGDEFENRGFRWFDVIAIRRPGMGVRATDEEVRGLAFRLSRDFPATNAGVSARVVSDFDYRMESGGTNAIALVTLVLFVVLITVVNVANLMVSRAVSRGRELALRAVLGADRRRQLVGAIAESTVLGAAGTVIGVLLSMWLIRLLPALVVQPPGLRPSLVFGVDARMLGFTAAVAVAVTVLASLAPAWAMMRSDIGALIKAGPVSSGATRQRNRLGSAFVIAQVAVSLALLSSAGLLARSFLETTRADLGFERKSVLTAWVTTDAVPAATTEMAVQRLSALPGVKAVAVAIRAPLSLSGGALAQRVNIPGRAAPQTDENPAIKFGAVSTNYFVTMGIQIVEGRGFADLDQRPGEPVVIVNEQFASRLLGDKRIGAMVRLGGPGGEDHRVVGIARTTVINRIGEPPEPYFYLPFWRGRYGELTFLLEIMGDTVPPAAARDILKRLDPRLDPRQLVTMAQYIRFSASDYQATAALASALATIGLLLTAVGVYGVIASRTTRRTREIGIRVALGATRGEILALVLGDGGRMALRGLAIGLPAAIVTTQLVRSLLFGVGPWDALAFGGATALLVLTVTAATLVPAWRATRVTPSTALREGA